MAKTRKATGKAKATRRVPASVHAKFANLPKADQKRIAAMIVGGLRKMG